MRRREFIAMLGAAVASSRVAAQQPGLVRRFGIIIAVGKTPELTKDSGPSTIAKDASAILHACVDSPEVDQDDCVSA